MVKVLRFIALFFIIAIFSPFFFAGATIGQFVGSFYYGYKAGRSSFLDIVKYIRGK